MSVKKGVFFSLPKKMSEKIKGFWWGAEVFRVFFEIFRGWRSRPRKIEKKTRKNRGAHQKPWFYRFPTVLFVFEEHQKPPILFGFYVSRKKKPYMRFGFYDRKRRALLISLSPPKDMLVSS
jgi:hypothetical protein